MGVLDGVLQVVVCFVVLKVVQIIIWNVRKAFYVHPWLVELVVAVLVIVLVWSDASRWTAVIALGALCGVLRGDQDEEERYAKRRLM